ncbi:unnamed protein product [Linum tenue]|uniref:Cytochrome P450 n=1 Tax=Linum tenue TaxID=586396 RepID=A0AAV0HDI8_9ROSI|nr:unnamed protein product [Linum tenue]
MAFLFFLLALPIILLILLQTNRPKRPSNLPPGPPGLPIIGNLLQIDNSSVHRSLAQLSQNHGPLMFLQLGFVPSIVISSSKLAKEVMKTQDLAFCSRPTLTGQQRLSYNGLDLVFSPYDSYYTEMRKICMVHLFHPARVQTFRPIREYEVSQMIHKITSKIGSTPDKPVNLSEAMMYLTSTIISRVGFGKRYEEEGIERSRFQSLLNESQAMFTNFFVGDYFPYMGFVDKLNGSAARLEKNFREFDDFYQEVIDERLDPKRGKNPEQEEDILDVLLQNVFLAGTDTGAATVVWAMSFLMKNPETMKKIQQEVRSSIEAIKGFVNEDDLHQLSYLKAVVKETFRLQPTVPLLVPRQTTEKTRLDGYDIPAKTLVQINTWAIGRDPEVWESPEEFKPDRFLDNSSSTSTVDIFGQSFELTPFGAGRRICPGLHMGLVTVELALANLVYKFDWEMPVGMKKEDVDMAVIPGITMHKRNHLCLLAKRPMI